MYVKKCGLFNIFDYIFGTLKQHIITMDNFGSNETGICSLRVPVAKSCSMSNFKTLQMFKAKRVKFTATSSKHEVTLYA